MLENELTRKKFKIDTPNVFLQTEIMYYMDGTTQELHKKMTSPEGLSHTYTSFINTTSSIGENRLIGLSNSTV
jgi:hypothetical protein